MSTFDKIKKVSVVIPVYNEEESLPQLLERTIKSCKQLEQEYELILVDDGSSDNSAKMLEEAAAIEENHVIAIILNRNYGQHSAIMAGFNQADGDLVITLDADLQNPPEEIPRLVTTAEEGYDVVGTRRRNRQDSWFRKTASKMINSMITKATGRSMGIMDVCYVHIVAILLKRCYSVTKEVPLYLFLRTRSLVVLLRLMSHTQSVNMAIPNIAF